MTDTYGIGKMVKGITCNIRITEGAKKCLSWYFQKR